MKGVPLKDGIKTTGCVAGEGGPHYQGTLRHRSERKYFTQFSHSGPTTQYLKQKPLQEERFKDFDPRY